MVLSIIHDEMTFNQMDTPIFPFLFIPTFATFLLDIAHDSHHNHTCEDSHHERRIHTEDIPPGRRGHHCRRNDHAPPVRLGRGSRFTGPSRHHRCGGRGSGVISSMAKVTGSRIVAVADLFEDRLNAWREKLSAVNRENGHPDIEQSHAFLGSKAYLRLLALKDVDAVLVSTPAFLHPLHLEAAIDAGKHAYCEKPVAVDVPGVEQVRRAGKKAQAR